jgi:hypothetical protein
VKSERAIQATVKPDKFDEVRMSMRAAIIRSLENGACVKDACNSAGIDRRTFYNWIKLDLEFEQAVTEARVSRIESVQSLAYQCAMKSLMDPRYQTSLIAWMNNEGGWGKSAPNSPSSALQSNVHVYMPDNGRKVRDVRTMSDEEIEGEIRGFLSVLDKRALLEYAGIPIELLPDAVIKLLDAHPAS